jgi:hypothetical protein
VGGTLDCFRLAQGVHAKDYTDPRDKPALLNAGGGGGGGGGGR